MTVNKVVNIEIAKQVFWVEEQGYNLLHNYLDTLKTQLAEQEYGDEIFADIELRFAELLFGVNEGKQRAITTTQITAFIEQVGYIESEIDEIESPLQSNNTPQPLKTYLDDQNKIVTGVCAGLSVRLRVPAFLLRLLFIGLGFAFGFGVLLYFVLWLSYEKNNTRNNALASQGQQLTASTIAKGSEIKESRFLVLQRIIFLPFSLLGLLIHAVGRSLVLQRKAYRFLLKNTLLLMMFIMLIFVGAGIVELNLDLIFPSWIQWILSAATLYLMLLASIVFIREFYQVKPYRRVNKVLKKIAIVPIVLICCSAIYLTSDFIDEKSTVQESLISITGQTLTLAITDSDKDNMDARDVDIQIVSSANLSNIVKVSVKYYSNGRGEQQLDRNLQAINYNYSIKSNRLMLDRYFQLQPDAYNRGQRVRVNIELPQHLSLISSHPVTVNVGRDAIDYEIRDRGESTARYFVASDYLHENNKINQQRISHNERRILLTKFCRTFFQKREWECHNSWEQSSANSAYLSLAYQDEGREIDEIRSVLDNHNAIELKQLSELNIKIAYLKQKHPQLDDLHQYIKHLLNVKHSMSATRQAPS
jgi:phage shock protein PspC (stress-responsive transcriptional regulator)